MKREADLKSGLGIFLGIGIVMTLLFGIAKGIADYHKSQDATVNNSGKEEISAPQGSSSVAIDENDPLIGISSNGT